MAESALRACDMVCAAAFSNSTDENLREAACERFLERRGDVGWQQLEVMHICCVHLRLHLGRYPPF